MNPPTSALENDMAKMTFPRADEDAAEAAAQAVRVVQSGKLAEALYDAAHELYRASEILTELVVEARALGGLGEPRAAMDVDKIVRIALVTVQQKNPDMAAIAHAAEQYRVKLAEYATPRPDDTAAEAAPVPCAGGSFDYECQDGPVPGTRYCWEHLIVRAKRGGMGNHFPVGSPEPSVANVPAGQNLVAENGVHWMRSSCGDWIAGGPVGDGGRYPWRSVNGDNENGRPVVRLLSGMASE